MKNWLVRVLSLYVFNVVVLLIIGWVTPVSVGWAVLWAALVLTAASLALKPLLLRVFRGAAAKSASSRTKVGEKTVQYVLVFVVELIVWVLTVWFSGVRVTDWFWGYALPPVLLLIAWVIYDRIDDRVEAKAAALYDAVEAKVGGTQASASDAPAAPETPANAAATSAARDELNDGLTPEQRRMLDEL